VQRKAAVHFSLYDLLLNFISMRAINGGNSIDSFLFEGGWQGTSGKQDSFWKQVRLLLWTVSTLNFVQKKRPGQAPAFLSTDR
jgi:hypothetical protein